MPRRFAHPFRQTTLPRYRHPPTDWSHGEDYLRIQQAALSRDFNRQMAMDDAEDSQVARRPEPPDYTKKDFKRAAEDLHSCIKEALEFFPKFDAEFINETKEIRKYGDEELLNIIWEKKVQRFENGPRASASNANTNHSGSGQGMSEQQHYGGHPEQVQNSSGISTSPGVAVMQNKIQQTVEAMLDCKSPEPVEDEAGVQIRIEEVRDFEERMRKTATRLYGSLGVISYSIQAFRRVIRDLTTMSQDLDLFPLRLWKADGEMPQ